MELVTGSIFKLKTEFMKEPVGTLVVCYEVYGPAHINGSFLTQNMIDLGGFSNIEIRDHLEFVSKTPHTYKFSNQAQLYTDISRGYFNRFFTRKINVNISLLVVGSDKTDNDIRAEIVEALGKLYDTDLVIDITKK